MAEKIPMVYFKDNVKQNYQVCTNGKIHRMAMNVFKQLRDNNSIYLLIRKDPKLNIKQTYDTFVLDADLLKEKTDGAINMYITGCIKDTAMHLFKKLVDQKILTKSTPIKYKEYKWINECTRSSITYAKKYKGPGYLYDFVSMYPSIMANNQNQFPISEGSWQTLNPKIANNQKYFSYGIYSCKLTPSGDVNKDLFRKFNKYNKYTHIDLNLAITKGYKLSFIDNGKPNALIYDTTCLARGAALFGDYVELLYTLKSQGVKVAKLLLNILWGALCQTSEIKLYASNDKPLKVYDFSLILSMIPMSDDTTIVNVIKKSNCYKSNFARLKPFLLAYGRKKLETCICNYTANMKWIFTDGFISDTKLPIKLGNNLGNLRYEGYCENCYVKNVMDKTKKECFIK